jgi:hypothetical protein
MPRRPFDGGRSWRGWFVNHDDFVSANSVGPCGRLYYDFRGSIEALVLFHRTHRDAAEAILRIGFRDGEGQLIADGGARGSLVERRAVGRNRS